MKKLKNLKPLKKSELKSTKGGFFPTWPIFLAMLDDSEPCYCDRTWDNGVSR